MSAMDVIIVVGIGQEGYQQLYVFFELTPATLRRICTGLA